MAIERKDSTGTTTVDLVGQHTELMEQLRAIERLMGKNHGDYAEIQYILMEEARNGQLTRSGLDAIESESYHSEVYRFIEAMVAAAFLCLFALDRNIDPELQKAVLPVIGGLLVVLSAWHWMLRDRSTSHMQAQENGFEFAQRMITLNQRAQAIVDTYAIVNPDTDPHLVRRS